MFRSKERTMIESLGRRVGYKFDGTRAYPDRFTLAEGDIHRLRKQLYYLAEALGYTWQEESAGWQPIKKRPGRKPKKGQPA